MKVDNPLAFGFIMQDEIYLLKKDKDAFAAQPEIRIPATNNRAAKLEQPDTLPENRPAVAPAAVTAKPAANVPVMQTPANEFNYLGKNNNNFLVLVNYAGQEHIPAGHLTALENILKRKNLLMDDVAILNVHKYMPVKLTQLAAYFAPTRLVIMGKDALPQGIGNLPLNQPLQGKKTHVLYSFSFDEMMSSNDNKRIFWEHMKTL